LILQEKKYEYSPEEDNHNSPTESLLAKLKHDDFDEENVAVLKEFEESENINILLKSKGDLKDSNKHGENYFLKYYLDHIISYEDFNVKKDPIFNIHDFSWKDQGYSFVRRYYSEEAAYLLDQEFNHIQELSYGTFNNHQSIKTEPFRKSIWLYIHRVQGVLHDDYNYSHINELLNPKLKKTQLKNWYAIPTLSHRKILILVLYYYHLKRYTLLSFLLKLENKPS